MAQIPKADETEFRHRNLILFRVAINAARIRHKHKYPGQPAVLFRALEEVFEEIQDKIVLEEMSFEKAVQQVFAKYAAMRMKGRDAEPEKEEETLNLPSALDAARMRAEYQKYLEEQKRQAEGGQRAIRISDPRRWVNKLDWYSG